MKREETALERLARLRREVAELAAQGVKPASIAVRVGRQLSWVKETLRELGLVDPDGRTPTAIAERLGVSLEEYVRERAAGCFRCRAHDGGRGAWLGVKEKSFTHGVEDTCKACCAARKVQDPKSPHLNRWRGKLPRPANQKPRVG